MNLKMLDEILFIRRVKSKISELKFLMSLSEKAVFLKTLEDKEFDLITSIERNNNNIRKYQEEGIETDNKIVNVPIDPNNSNYEEIRTHGLKLSLDEKVIYLYNVIDGVSRNLEFFDFTKDEKDKYLEYLKEYKEELLLEKEKRKNNAKYNSDIYTPSEEGYVPLSQNEMFTEVYKNIVEEDSKKTRK